MNLFKCRGCEARETELERLHRQLQRATDLLAEKHEPGVSQRVPHAMPLPEPKVGADAKRYIPRIKQLQTFPGYDPEVETEMVEFVED
jgi:hypothetical protein